MPASTKPTPRLLLALRTALFGALLWLGTLPLAAEAEAAPPSNTQRGSSNSTGARGSGGPGGSYTTKNSGFQPPDFVYGGNAASFLAPVQFGLTPKGFVPRARLGLQYDRQLHRAHWLHVGAAALFDRGSWRHFGMDSCGLESQAGTCQAGTVAGMDIAAGYTHKLFVEAKPWIVPTFRVGLAGGFWYYPRISGTREQTRELTWILGIQASAGVRFFLLRELALGIDIELRPSLAVHRERAEGATDNENLAGFVLPLQVLPLIVEWRF